MGSVLTSSCNGSCTNHNFIRDVKTRHRMIGRILHFQRRLTGYSFSEALRRYFIFVSGGFVGWLVIIALHEYLQSRYGTNPVLSYGIGIMAADVFVFAYHRLITFKIRTAWKIRLVKFTSLLLVISFVNWALFSIARSTLNLPLPDPLLSFLITGILSVANFMISRIMIFRHH